MPTLGARSAGGKRRPPPPTWTTSCGRARRPIPRTATTSFTTIGLCSRAGARARSATTARTRSTSPPRRRAAATPRAAPPSAGADDDMTALHIDNFVAAIRTGAALRQPIEEGATSVLLCHLGNIAQWTGRALRTDPQSGRIEGDDQAMGYWQREYAPGWAPAV